MSVKKDKLWVLPPPPPVTLMYVLFRKVFRGLSSVKSRGISRYLDIISFSRLAQLKIDLQVILLNDRTLRQEIFGTL